MAAYREWANTYNKDLIDKMGYVAPVLATDALQRYAEDRHKPILDVGCGTGIVGDILHRHGYRLIDGLDYSKDMLSKASEKGVYRIVYPGRRIELQALLVPNSGLININNSGIKKQLTFEWRQH